MENLEKQINLIVAEELDENDGEGPKIHSAYEGCAYLMKEVEEARNDQAILREKMIALWEKTKTNNPSHDLKYEASMVKNFAIDLAVDSCRVAVMAERLISFLEEGEKNDES